MSGYAIYKLDKTSFNILMSWFSVFFNLGDLLFSGIDGPVTTHHAPPEPVVGGLLVNVGSEEVEPQPRAKVLLGLYVHCLLNAS